MGGRRTRNLGRRLVLSALLVVISLLSVASCLFSVDVLDKSGQERGDRLEVVVLGGSTAGSSVVGCGLFGAMGILGGLVIELFFGNDSVGNACLGSGHEGGQ